MKLLKIIVYLPFLFLVLILMMIRPLKILRFHEILSDRIGHFGCIIELYLCQRDLNNKKYLKEKYLDFFCFSSNVCNLQIKKFWEKQLNIMPFRMVAGLIFWFNLLPSGSKHLVFFDKNSLRRWINFRHKDVNNLLDKSKIHYKFTDNEVKSNKNLLRKLGIDNSKKTALLFLRDNVYFKKVLKFKVNYSSVRDKNSNINTYTKSVKFLIKKGYQVIRVGKLSEKKLKINNKNYFDITNNSIANDSLQTYLISKSKFLLSTNSGITYAAAFIFRKPCLITNHIPHGHFHIESKLLTINFKKVFSIKKKRLLKLTEIFQNNLSFNFSHKNYKKFNCRLIDQSENEIYFSVLDFVKRVENKFKKEKKEKLLEQKYIKNFNNIIEKDPFRKNTFGVFKGNFGKNYLKRNKYLFY